MLYLNATEKSFLYKTTNTMERIKDFIFEKNIYKRQFINSNVSHRFRQRYFKQFTRFLPEI